MKIEIKTKETFNTFAARRILSIIEKTVDTKKFCTVALSGGKTPMGIFRKWSLFKANLISIGDVFSSSGAMNEW
ncbi:MAG: 6-phosphogluconolactonase [Saprospiraceae bacterium]|nr:6-phosphogluconolactonase [Candidatus Brachybacter algidus]